jgi:hypothetical protein
MINNDDTITHERTSMTSKELLDKASSMLADLHTDKLFVMIVGLEKENHPNVHCIISDMREQELLFYIDYVRRTIEGDVQQEQKGLV